MMFWLFAILLFAVLFGVSMFFVFILKDELKNERNENHKFKMEKKIKDFKNDNFGEHIPAYRPLDIRYRYNDKKITNLINIEGEEYRIEKAEYFTEDTHTITTQYINGRKDNILIMPKKDKILFLEKVGS